MCHLSRKKRKSTSDKHEKKGRKKKRDSGLRKNSKSKSLKNKSLKSKSLKSKNLESKNLKRKRESDEELPTLNKKPRLRSKSQQRLVRTNSRDNLNEHLTINKRLSQRMDTSSSKEFDTDHSIIAIYSREASERFAINFQEKVKNPEDRLTNSSRKKSGVKEKEIKKMLKRQSYTTMGPKFQPQVQALLENKMIPHVITVIEGKEEQKEITIPKKIKGKEVILNYKLKNYIQGTTNNSRKDDKQSIAIYIREDMSEAYKSSQVVVEHGDGDIRCVALDYSTKDGEKYRTLIVHIPNDFVGTKGKENETHEAFVKYAKKLKKSDNITVTGYHGDTNFTKEMLEGSVPSMGGILSNGRTISPQSSGAKRETNFMQVVSLSDSDKDSFLVRQCSTLNLLNIESTEEHKTAIDHFSMMSYTSHKLEIFGRNPKFNSTYYG